MDNNELKEILEKKEMVLHHVLYEMQMYLFTLLELKSKSQRVQLKTNMIMVSHETHLRNLLEFFRSSKYYENNIIFTDLFDAKKNNEMVTELAIDDKIFCGKWAVKKVVNKSISHLTIERVTMDITQPTICAIKRMEKVVPNKIKKFIEYLATDLKEEWEIKESVVIRLVEERDSEHMQKIIESINDMLNELDIN